MSYFRPVITRTNGPDSHITNIQDVVTINTQNAGLRVYTASGADGGILVRDASRDMRLLEVENFGFDPSLGTIQLEHTTLDGRDVLLAYGAHHAGVQGFWVDANGRLSGGFTLPTSTTQALTAMEMIETSGGMFFFTADTQNTGMITWQRGNDGRLREIEQQPVGLEQGGSDIFAMEHVSFGSRDYLLVLSSGGNALFSYRVNSNGTLDQRDVLDLTEGLSISTPTALAQVTFSGQTFVLVGAAGSSSISVMTIDNNGRMVVTDQVNDQLNTRFQSLTQLEVVIHDGKAYVIAGGADDGLTLMALLPNGRLVHLETIPDDLSLALSNPSAIDVISQGDTLQVFVTGLDDSNFGRTAINHLEIDPNDGGTAGQLREAGNSGGSTSGTNGADHIMGGRGNDQLRGNGGSDIIADGDGTDRLWGGAGADVFVMARDGDTDRIEDFEIGVDRIDLSEWGRIYSVDAVNIQRTSNGAVLTYGNERLEITTSNGNSLGASDFDTQDLTDLWHLSVDVLPKGDQLLEGTDLDDQISGSLGEDTLIGGEGRDYLRGWRNDDVLIGETQDAVFDPVAAQVFRLYQATLDRAPDITGHMAWTERLLTGTHDLVEVSRGFVNSAEFRATYGSTSNSDFVTLLYQNVLGRAPDAGGLRGWTDALAQGSSRAQVVIGFSESAEFKETEAAAAMSVSRAGHQKSWFDDVFRLYQATLDRTADMGGLLGWTENLAQGASFQQVVGGFVNSPEFRATYGDLNDREFVTLLYENVLDRAPDPVGLTYWREILEDGGSRAQVVAGFSQSAEFVNVMTPVLQTWVLAQGEDDRLDGGTGDNILFGGLMSDCFVFNAGADGQQTVADLEQWDQLMFRGFGYRNANDVRAHMVQRGDDVVFWDQGVEVILTDFQLSALSDEMFQF